MLTAVAYRVSWNANQASAVRALFLALALTAAIAVLVLGVAAIAAMPLVVGCCSAAVATLPQVAIVVAVFAGAWLVKP